MPVTDACVFASFCSPVDVAAEFTPEEIASEVVLAATVADALTFDCELAPAEAPPELSPVAADVTPKPAPTFALLAVEALVVAALDETVAFAPDALAAVSE